jgi:hypothetical protein
MSSSDTRPNTIVRQRLAIVAGSSSTEVATRTKTVLGLGSSRVFRSAFAASSFIAPASSRRKTFRRASRGASVARDTTARA